jgi:alkylation response protein AidB-like acyl-CoA dehydrogenase
LTSFQLVQDRLVKMLADVTGMQLCRAQIICRDITGVGAFKRMATTIS